MITLYPPAAVRSVGQLRQEAARLQLHPDFSDVIGEYTRKLSAYREASRPMAKLIANEDRYRALNYFYSLWAENLGAGGNGSLTYGQLFEICRRGEVSPRILKTMLSLADFVGFFDRRPNPEDGRSWLYTPTEIMLRFPQQWLLPAAEALDALLPNRARAARLRDDFGVLVHFFRSAGREFAAGVQPMALQPEFMAFYGQKEGGAVFTMALLLAEQDAEAPPSRAAIAERYGMTKSQVTKLIETGRAAGLLDFHNGFARPTAALRDAHAEWAALSLVFLGHHLWPSDDAQHSQKR